MPPRSAQSEGKVTWVKSQWKSGDFRVSSGWKSTPYAEKAIRRMPASDYDACAFSEPKGVAPPLAISALGWQRFVPTLRHVEKRLAKTQSELAPTRATKTRKTKDQKRNITVVLAAGVHWVSGFGLRSAA